MTVNPLVSVFSKYKKCKLKPNYEDSWEHGVKEGESKTYNDGKVGAALFIYYADILDIGARYTSPQAGYSVF